MPEEEFFNGSTYPWLLIPLSSNNISLSPKNLSISDRFGINIWDPPQTLYHLSNSLPTSASRLIYNNKKNSSDLSFTILLDSNQGLLTDDLVKSLSKTQQVASVAALKIVNDVSSKFVNKISGDSEAGRIFGSIFSSGISAGSSSLGNNLLTGSSLSDNVLKDSLGSMAGTAVGIGANYLGQGINNLGGNTWGSRFVGQATATGLGTVGGLAVSNLIKYGTLAGKAADGSKMALVGKAGLINPYALLGSVVGSALSAANGPSPEYRGKYGSTTLTLDTVYDGLSAAVNAIPVYGLFISAGMAMNKGLSNMFGGTSGMTKNDAWLGSAFVPFYYKWINTLSGNTTSKFNNYNQFTHLKAFDFMGNAYGNTGDRIIRANEESGKRYGGGVFGLFNSNDAYEEALKNIEEINESFPTLLSLADLNYRLNIRAFDMSSINNLRYALNINGGFKPLVVGKQGMKIFNNATNHNIGLRLLSAAALIDNKAIILCNAHD